MKITSKQEIPKKFNPIEINITIESEAELNYMLCLANVANAKVYEAIPMILREQGGTVNLDTGTDVGLELWRMMKAVYENHTGVKVR